MSLELSFHQSRSVFDLRRSSKFLLIDELRGGRTGDQELSTEQKVRQEEEKTCAEFAMVERLDEKHRRGH